MLDIFCANPECRWHNEKKGGRFLNMKARNGRPAGWYCDECVKAFHAHEAKSAFEFDIEHLEAGKTIHCTGLRHLEQIQKQYGVVSAVANFDARNLDTPPQMRTAPQYQRRFHG